MMTSALVLGDNSEVIISDVLQELRELIRSGAFQEAHLDCLALRSVLSDLVFRVEDSYARRGGVIGGALSNCTWKTNPCLQKSIKDLDS
jgi:hypothetical protein